jgi:hypothetical protein
VVLRDEDDPVAEATAGEVPLSVGDVLERHLLDGESRRSPESTLSTSCWRAAPSFCTKT